MRTLRDGWKVWLLLALMVLPLTGRAAMFQVPVAAGGGSSQTTGSVTVVSGSGINLNGTVLSLSTTLSNLNGTGAITNIGSALLSASNRYAREIVITTNDNISLILSNAPNDTLYHVTPGNYAITPSVLSSNLTGGTQFRGITMAGKTNVAVIAHGLATLDGSSEYGELLVVTNSSGIRFVGLGFYGKTNHNWTQVIPTNHLWAGIRIATSEKITFENCDISRHFNHGIADLAANFSSVRASTNQILLLNNTFSDIGSWRTNNVLTTDGTAIVPTGWTMHKNRIKNVLRAIEPYLAADGQPSVIWNCIITDNEIEDAYEYGITTVGNTNFHGLIARGNIIRNNPGASYHGSNIMHTGGAGILWNGGHKWTIDDNQVSGVWANGIWVGGNVHDGAITRNRIYDITNNAAAVGLLAQSAYRLRISDNTISGARNSGVYLYGLRDSDVIGNHLPNPSHSGSGIRITSSGSQIASNLNIRNNFIFDSVNSRLTYGVEDQLGGTFKIRFSGNDIQNAGTRYYNQSGTEWTIRDLDAGSTNRLIAAHEVRTQIEPGSNITFATNSSGVVTITGSAGGGGSTNGSPVIAAGSLVASNGIYVGATQRYKMVADSSLWYIYDNVGGNAPLAINDSDGSVSIQTDISARLGTFASNNVSGRIAADSIGVTSSVTAQSFLSSGTGAALMSVSSYQGDAMAFTRATNSPAATGGTNDLQFDRSTTAVGQTFRIHSTASGRHVITNANNASIAVSGAGSGNTNYTINLVPGNVNDFHLGSSNVMITAVMGGIAGTRIYWNAYVTNLSAATWGIGFSAVTNRWRFSGVYGTNSPTILTNNTELMISGMTDGTNTLVGFTYYAPGL